MSCDYILLASGEKFIYDDIDKNQFNIIDIATSLAYTNRFYGHRGYAPVAAHCLRVALMSYNHFMVRSGNTVAAWNACLIGLLHDASEAYLGDVVSPLKHSDSMRGYQRIETRLQSMIYKQFGAHVTEDLASIVKSFDSLDLEREMNGEIGDISSPEELIKEYVDLAVRCTTIMYDSGVKA